MHLEPYQTSLMNLYFLLYFCINTPSLQFGKVLNTALHLPFNIFPLSLLGYVNEYMNILFSFWKCAAKKQYKTFYWFPYRSLYMDHGNTKCSYIYTIKMWKILPWKTSRWNATLIYTINKNNKNHNINKDMINKAFEKFLLSERIDLLYNWNISFVHT